MNAATFTANLDAATNPEDMFAGTEMFISFDAYRLAHQVCTASADAIGWDGADEATNCTLLSPAHGVHCYANVKITGRRVRKHAGGIWGVSCQVQFTGPDSTNETHAAIVFTR